MTRADRRLTSVKKLNGVVYTPLHLARAMVARLPMTEGSIWLDPACGEGVFLVAALERAAALGVPIRLEGWDIDGPALATAETRLTALAGSLGAPRCWTLSHRDALAPEQRRFDIVVGNPPYLESKRMPEPMKARLRADCPVSSTGAFDLYAAFIELSAHLLSKTGMLSFLVPNRLAVTANNEALRRWLVEWGEVTAIDLSHKNPFPDAAVYPMVVEWRPGLDSALVTGGLDGAGGRRFGEGLVGGRLGGRWPLPPDPESGALVSRLLQDVPGSVGDRFDIRWTVSFHASGLRDRYVSDQEPDSPHARRFVGGGRFAGNREVEPYHLRWGGAWIDHDAERARRDRNPLPPLSLFLAPKVAICQNARRCRAAVDLDGYVLKDTFLLAALKPETPDLWLYWLPVVLHSRLFHVCYDALNGGTRKGGGYLHFLGSYLERFPLPPPPEGLDARALYCNLQSARTDAQAAEAQVCRAYGVSPAEAAWLAARTVPEF